MSFLTYACVVTWKQANTHNKAVFCSSFRLQALLLSTSFWCYFFTRPVSSLCSVVNNMFALKGENNCKYKHGELHLGLEQTCISDSSDSHLRGETDPQITVRPATRWLMLSLTSTNTHRCTHTLIKDHAPRHRSPQRGQAGKEVLGWAAVRSSRNIRMFPLQQSAGIRSKLTDR